ncbi:hypothetical protein L210DRAFT_971799 [Boletus edulis BED1]|uniref:Uncharacterized protein n=1 Tax=Boletus edulis BED1 TaxID=1328754 RepID=A0AAD4BLV6_BOLED|nr:hypothetical protein L210DRAFT_971799 [Boletus edulis BED1]
MGESGGWRHVRVVLRTSALIFESRGTFLASMDSWSSRGSGQRVRSGTNPAASIVRSQLEDLGQLRVKSWSLREIWLNKRTTSSRRCRRERAEYPCHSQRYAELYTPDYAGIMIKGRWVIEKLLTQAGVRLAAVLNWIFAELDEGEARRAYLRL